MKARLEDKNKAIKLRKTGLSYKEIQKLIPVTKSLLSNWFKNIELSQEEIDFLKSRVLERQNTGRINASISNRKRRVEREVENLKLSQKIFDDYKNDPIFIMGVCLYWAEGSKRTSDFQFINSDESMILFMYKWVQKYLKVDTGKIKCRLFTHKIGGHENHIDFWSKLLNLEKSLFYKTIYKPTTHSVKKNPKYNGCLRLTIGGITYLRTMKNWQKLLYQYYVNLLMRS